MNYKKIWTAFLLCALTVFFAVGAFGCAANHKDAQLRVSLKGDCEISLNHGQTYEEAGATAQLLIPGREPQEVQVNISGSVNNRALGAYLIKYTAECDGVLGTAYRLVRIVDTEAPLIELVEDPEYYTLPNETYVEQGYTASDDYDGDLTEQVIRIATREKVIYRVTDSAGNMSQVERTIAYNDPVPPQIQLKGSQTVVISQGSGYQEAGYTATDNCDGDITAKVTVSGSVNVKRPGYYTVRYTVKDTYGNEASASRAVYVKPSGSSAPPQTVVPNGKVIYLTFDDGPGPRTPELLDILKKYNVKATFFVVNTGYIGTIKRAAAEGHSIAVHTKTHVFKEIYASEEAYFNDLYSMQAIIKQHTGIETTLLRFPGGSSNTISRFNKGIMTRLTEAVVQQGFQYFDWNVDSKDAGGARTAEQVYNNVINGIGNKNTSIVLQHDIKGFSIDAVEMIILWGLENGYTFLPLQPNSPGCHHRVNN